MTDEDPTLTGAARVGGRVSLSNVRLWEAEVRQRVPATGNTQISLSTVLESAAVVGDAGAFQVHVHYQVRGVAGPDTADDVTAADPADETDTAETHDDHDLVLSITAMWIIDYQLADGQEINDEDLQAFAAVSGTFAAHPYMRELVHGLTSRLGLPPLVLDVMRVPLDTAAASRGAVSTPDAGA